MAGNTLVCTTPNAIRAAIGATSEEVSDELIIDLMVEDQLILFLTRVYPDYEALIAANGFDQAPTTDQKNLFRALKLCCMYAAAVFVLQGGQYLMAQQIESGSVTTTRFSKDDLETTLSRMEAMRDQYLGVLSPDSADITLNYVSPLVTASPDYDPVTGRGGPRDACVIGYHDPLRAI